MSCGGGGGGELGVGVVHAVEVAADVANAGEQAGALAFVRVRLQFLDEIHFDHRNWNTAEVREENYLLLGSRTKSNTKWACLCLPEQNKWHQKCHHTEMHNKATALEEAKACLPWGTSTINMGWSPTHENADHACDTTTRHWSNARK